ncbi:MAG TPA: efflux transporter outer membrane subunit [Casimicrobiaceae bacterium]|jgi:NodT family efflux transporter outer membrane factor (OMF) lipoprotein
MTRRAIFLGVVSATLAGCVVGPNFRQPDPPVAGRYTENELPAQTASAPGAGGASQRFMPGQDLPAQWWQLFHSEPLDALVRDAIVGSPNLTAAEAALRVARENLAAQTGALLYPRVDANLGATREKLSGAALGQPNAGSTIFSLYNASVNVSYALDVAGGNKRELEALQSLVDYQDYQLAAAHLALTSNIVTAAIREGSLRAQIDSTREIIDAQNKQLDLVRRQFELGAVGRLNLVAQQAQAAQTEALLPPLERDLAQTRHQLAALAGRVPSDGGIPTFDLASLSLPPDLPLSVPSALARQRPDIRAAEALLHQASAQIGVATANQYPQVNLTGSFGAQATELHNLFAGPSIWSIGAGLLQPLFHAGELEHKRLAAVAGYDQAAAQYRETVLLAFQNVADALRALEADARTLKAQSAAEALARDTLNLTTRQFQLGATNYIALLDAQRQFNLARFALVQVQANRYADTAALFQALGGGWWSGDTTNTVSNNVSNK